MIISADLTWGEFTTKNTAGFSCLLTGVGPLETIGLNREVGSPCSGHPASACVHDLLPPLCIVFPGDELPLPQGPTHMPCSLQSRTCTRKEPDQSSWPLGSPLVLFSGHWAAWYSLWMDCLCGNGAWSCGWPSGLTSSGCQMMCKVEFREWLKQSATVSFPESYLLSMSLIPFLSSSLVFSVGTAGFMAALELSSWLAFSAFLHPSDHLRSLLKSAVAAQEGPSFSFFSPMWAVAGLALLCLSDTHCLLSSQ